MSLISPVVGQQPTVPDLSGFGYSRFPDVQPFSQRTASGYQETLEEILAWIQRKLVPFLIHSNPQGVWDANVLALINAVNSALSAQTTANAQAIQAALNAISEADIPITDPAILAVLNSASSATKAWLDSHYAKTADVTAAHDLAVAAGTAAANAQTDASSARGFTDHVKVYYAPKPSGGDDTASLMALIALAITTRGELILDYGTYLCNLDMVPAGSIQPIIRGRGRHYTILKAYDVTKPVTKFNGGSGTIAGGGLKSLGIDGGGRNNPASVGIAFSGCGGVACEDVEINSCAVGVLWWNERGQDFTEFDTFEGSIYNTKQPFVYRADNGVESFHGSGPVGNTVVGMPSDVDGPVIGTVGNALPYNAPLYLTIFFSKTTQFVMNYVNTAAGRHASFHGRVNIEGASDGQLVHSNGQRVLLAGTITHFGSKDATLGQLFLCYKINYEGGSVNGELLPVSQRATLKGSPTQIFAGILRPGEVGHVVVHIGGANYDKCYLLRVYQSPYDGSGVATIVATFSNIDNAGMGDPTFSWNNGLYISGNFSQGPTAYARMEVLGGQLSGNQLMQLA